MPNPYNNNPYLWNNHTMQVGVANCDPDQTDQAIMWLWYELQRVSWNAQNSGGSGEVRMWAMKTPPAGWLECNGAAVLRTTYPDLDTAIYCGNTENATASWGYRCTEPGNPTGTRSTSGNYLILPDMRGTFARGWDNGRNLDTNRKLWEYQGDSMAGLGLRVQNRTFSQAYTAGTPLPSCILGVTNLSATNGTRSLSTVPGGVSTDFGPLSYNPIAGDASWWGAWTNLDNFQVNATGTENRPKSLAMMYCIKI